MKIAHVVSTFYPRLGGMGAVVNEEAKGLAAKGHKVTVFTMLYPGMAEREERLGFNIRRLKPIWRLGDGGLTRGLAQKLKDFDVVHLHYPWYGGAEEVWRAKVKYNKNYVVTFHMEAEPVGALKRVLHFFYNFWYARKILGGAHRVAVVDQLYFKTSRWRDAVKKDKLTELTNPVDLNIFKPQPGSWAEFELEKLTGQKNILFVGNLLPVKRLDLLLGALKSMAGVNLVVAGGGYAEDSLKKLARTLQLENKVFFIGPITDRDKLARLYNLVAATVIPARQESFSLVALEALASGCPVVASRVPGLAARVTDGKDGFLFASGSAHDLAQKIQQVLSLEPSLKQSFKDFGRQKMATEYGLSSHLEKLETLYAQAYV